MIQPAFRFAPSPNGRLHLGHAYSALLNARLAADAAGHLLIRIEDIDQPRCPRHLADAALEDLAWLGLRWEQPVRFQGEHMVDYHEAQARLAGMGVLYPCFCTRRLMAVPAPAGFDPEGQPLYPGTCRHVSAAERMERIAAGEPHAMRLAMDRAIEMIGGAPPFNEQGEAVRPDPRAWGDVVLVRKDIGTSYHVAVVVDDALQEISTVVRGRDLFQATAIHRVLQHLLGLPQPAYHHHPLIDDGTGRKLAKSAGDRSLASLRREGIPARRIREELGFA